MNPRRFRIKTLDLANTLSQLTLEKKARQPCLLDVGDLTSYTTYLLIVTGTSDRHLRALADHIIEQLKAQKIKPLGIEGYGTGQWVLLDYGEVIVHLFQEAAREYYDLEGLWNDAKILPIKDTG